MALMLSISINVKIVLVLTYMSKSSFLEKWSFCRTVLKSEKARNENFTQSFQIYITLLNAK